jgi:hypothetical protein
VSGNERFQQQIAVLNMRAQNVSLAFNDLLREVGAIVKRVAEMEKENSELKNKENTELKAKQEKTSKK